jgi:hypothetical protein
MKITMLMLILSAPYVIMEVKLQGACKLVVTRGANNVFLKRAHCTYNCFYILHPQTIFSYQDNNSLSVMFIHCFRFVMCSSTYLAAVKANALGRFMQLKIPVKTVEP